MRSSTRRDELTDAALLDFARFVWGHRPGELSVREYNRRVRLWHRKRELAAGAEAEDRGSAEGRGDDVNTVRIIVADVLDGSRLRREVGIIASIDVEEMTRCR